MTAIVLVETVAGKPLSDHKFTCCICRLQWIGLGCNPWPVNDAEGERCCGPCDVTQVTPLRLELRKAWLIDADTDSD